MTASASGIPNLFKIGQRVVTIHDNQFTISNIVCIMWNHEKQCIVYELNGIETKAFEEKYLAVDFSRFFKEANNFCLPDKHEEVEFNQHTEIPATEEDMNDMPKRRPFKELTIEEYKLLKQKEAEGGNA